MNGTGGDVPGSEDGLRTPDAEVMDPEDVQDAPSPEAADPHHPWGAPPAGAPPWPPGPQPGGPPPYPPHGGPWSGRPPLPPMPMPVQAPQPPVEPRGRKALWYALGGAACMFAGYWIGSSEDRILMTLTGGAIGLLLSTWAVIYGARINIRATAEGKRAPAALGAIACGLVLSLFGLMSVVGGAIVYPERHVYEQCMSGANTVIAQNQCAAGYDRALQERGLSDAGAIGP